MQNARCSMEIVLIMKRTFISPRSFYFRDYSNETGIIDCSIIKFNIKQISKNVTIWRVIITGNRYRYQYAIIILIELVLAETIKSKLAHFCLHEISFSFYVSFSLCTIKR